MTKREQLAIYAKCLSDPIYCIEHFFETFDKTQDGYVPFKLFPKQKEIINAYETHRSNIIAKPRQAGVSTTTAAYMAWKMAFADSSNPEKVLILANKQDLSQEILKKVKEFLRQFPDWMGLKFDTDSKKNIVLNNKSEGRALATSTDALRGFTPTFLVMDEAAFIEKGDIVFTTALAAIGTGGHITLLSTPNGLDPLYYKTYDGAKNGRNNFNIVEMRWFQDPRYNKGLKWHKGEEIIEEKEFVYESYEKMIKDGYKPHSEWYDHMCRQMNGNERMIAQELDVSFVGSGGNVVDEEYIAHHETYNQSTPMGTAGFDNNIWVWKQPEQGHQYIMGVDVSRGDGEDFSSMVVIDFTTGEQVMEYQGKLPPDTLAEIVYEWGGKYEAYTVVDITGGMGVATVLKLLEMEYKYLHYDNPRSRVLSQRKDLSGHKKDNKIPGFNVGANRLNMIAEMERCIRQNEVIIRSSRLLSEFKTFVYKNGRPDHMDGYHDDLIMALAMGLWVLQTSFKNLEKLNKQTKAMLNAWGVTGGDTEPNSPPSGSNYGGNLPNSEHMWILR